MTQIELTDFQTFITSKARENYFNAVKKYYDYARFTEENCQYQLYLYTTINNPIEQDWRTSAQKEFDIIMGA